jgi:tripartite-type tricarboxylate transporter receptor subunit TctC
MSRRSTSAFLIAGACLAWSPSVFSQNAAAWPGSTPIRIVTPTPVGVGSDAFTRLYGEHLGRALKTAVIVENRPGAAGTLGTDVVAKSPPNGYTLLVSTSLPFTTSPYLMSKVPYSAQKDFVPVVQLYRGGSFVIASPAFPGKSLADLVAAAKRAPGSINYASYGPGSTAHLGIELLQDAAEIQMTHIPYKQSAIPDLIGGQVMIGWEPPPSALPNIRTGKIKALAYTGDRRSPALPDVPTLAESYPGLEMFTWVGVWAPAGTPEAIVQRLQAAFAAISKEPDVVKALVESGSEPMATTQAQMASTIEREAQAMSRLIKAKHITMN